MKTLKIRRGIYIKEDNWGKLQDAVYFLRKEKISMSISEIIDACLDTLSAKDVVVKAKRLWETTRKRKE